MGERIEDGGPAFPAEAFAAQHCPGMSLRDWFAGQALAGVLAGSHKEIRAFCVATGGQADVTVAKMAYEIGDAMLAARSRSSSVEG